MQPQKRPRVLPVFPLPPRWGCGLFLHNTLFSCTVSFQRSVSLSLLLLTFMEVNCTLPSSAHSVSVYGTVELIILHYTKWNKSFSISVNSSKITIDLLSISDLRLGKVLSVRFYPFARQTAM